MKRKIAALLICAMLVAAVLPGAALACDTPASQTEMTVTVPVSPEALRLELMTAAANAQILWLVYYAQLTPYDDVQWLLAAVENTVRPVFAYADAIGAVVVCEYTPYVVDGQTVLIDPIRVVKV